MAEPDIRVLVGVKGGGSIDGESGREILKSLTKIANTISKNNKLDVVVNVNVAKTTENFQKQLEKALRHVKLDANTIIDVTDGTKRIATFGANVQSAIDSAAKNVVKRSAEIKKSLETMTDGDFSTFKDTLDKIQKESDALVASVDKINTMADLSNILDQFDMLEKRIRNIQKAAGHKSVAFSSADDIINFADRIDGKSIDLVQDRISEVRTEVSTLLQTLNVTDDVTIIDSVTNRLNVLGQELIELRSTANNSFDFDTEFAKLTTSAENAIKRIRVIQKNDLAGENTELFTDIENRIREALSKIDNVGSAEIFTNISNAIKGAIDEIDVAVNNIKFDKLSEGGFAEFNQELTNARNLLVEMGSHKYKHALDLITEQEKKDFHEVSDLINQILNKHANGVAFSGGYKEYASDIGQLTQAFDTLKSVKKSSDAALKVSGWALQERQNFNVLTNSVQRYYDTYKDNISKIPSLNAGFASFLNRLEIPSNFKGGIKEARIEFSNLRREFQLTGGESQTLMQRLQALFGTRLGSAAIGAAVMTLRNGLRQTVKHVIDINTSMTELRKVSNSSADALGEFFDRTREKAVDLSTEITTLVDATANFSRLGYGLQEAETLGEWATILANVADGMNSIDDATNSMISTMAAFGIEADKANEVVDKFNKIGNEYPISTAGAAEALKRSASSLSEASNTIDESLALIATANSVVQNPESVGTTLKTLSLRMRSAKVELEEAGEESEGAAESVADLRKEILALTNQRVDIMIDDDTFKSTYKMLEEISAVWNDINDVDRAALLELIAGKRNANVAAAIINNFDMAKEALEGSINAEGSAMREYEVWMDSIQAKTQQFTAQFQSLSGVLVEQDWIKDVVDMGTELLKLLTALVEKIGSIPILVTALSTLATLKNVGWARLIPDFDSNKYTLNTQKLTEAIQDLYWGYKSIAEVGGEAAQGLKEGLTRAIFGKASGVTALWENDRQGLFDSIVNGLKNAQFSGGQDAVDTFWKGLESNTSISESSAKALRAYFDTVDTGEASLKGFNEFIPTFNAGLEETHRAAKKSQLAMNIWAGVINGAINLAITGVIMLISNWINSQKKLIQEGHDLVEVYKENVSAINESIKKVQNSRSEFEHLAKGVSDSGENVALSAEQYERYIELANEIAELSPELVRGYDAEGNAIIAKNAAIDQTIAKLKEEIELEKAKLLINKDAVDAAFRSDYKDIDVIGAREALAASQGLLDTQLYELSLLRKNMEVNGEDEGSLKREAELMLAIQETQAKLNVDEAHYQLLLQQRQALVNDYYNNYGSAWVTLNKDYKSMSAEEKSLTDQLASYINPSEVEDYERALLQVVNAVNSLTSEQVGIINSLPEYKQEYDYLDYLYKVESFIKTLPQEIQPVMRQMSGVSSDTAEAIDLINKFRSNFGLIGFGEELIFGETKNAKTEVEKYLETLSVEDWKLIITAGIEIDRDTGVNYLKQQIDDYREQFADDEPIYIPFSFSDYSDAVEDVKSNAEILTEALQKLDSGELQKSDLWDLMTKFPALVDYIDTAAAGFGNLREGLLLTISALDDSVMEELDKKIAEIKTAIDVATRKLENGGPAGSVDYLLESDSELQGLYSDLREAEQTKEIVETLNETIKDGVASLNSLRSTYKTLASAASEYNTTGSISADTFESLLDVEDRYLSYLTFTENGLNLNTEALKRQIKAQTELTAFNRASQFVKNAQAAIEAGVAETFLAESMDLVTDSSWDSLKALAASEEMQKNFGSAIIDVVNSIQESLDKIDWSSAGGSTDPWKDEFESYLSDLEFLRDTNKITEEQYYAELNRLNEKYFANNKKYLDDYRKYYIEVYDYLLQRQEDMLNAIADAAQKALDAQIEARDKEIAARQEIIEAKQAEIDALEEQYEKEDRLFELQKARDNYNQIAANKNTRLYTRDKGWIYTADPHALQEAKDKLDELEKENARAEAKEAIEDEIKAIEDEIKVLEEEKEAIEALKDKWGEAADDIGKSLEEYMLDLQLTTAFTKMSYDQMSQAVLQFAALNKLAMGGGLIGTSLSGFGNIYSTSGASTGGANTGAINVQGETNPNTGAGGSLTGVAALRQKAMSSNIAQESNKEAEKLLELESDTEKNTANSYDASIQLIRWDEDIFAMTEDGFAEQYDLTTMLYDTTAEGLTNAYDTNAGVYSILELFEMLMENGIKTVGSSGGGLFGSSGGSDSSDSSGSSGGSRHGRISYDDMTDEQRERAQRMADKFGLNVEDIRMYDVGDNGLIIVGQDQLTTQDQQMVAKSWADTIYDITDEMREEYNRPWTEEELRAQAEAKIGLAGSRASGDLSIARSGLYNVDERGLETIIHPENGRVTWLEQGDRVYTASQTKKNYDMMDLFARVENLELLKQSIFDNPLDKIAANLSRTTGVNPIRAIPTAKAIEKSNDIYISGCDFNMPNVTDRESFIKDLTRIAKYK